MFLGVFIVEMVLEKRERKEKLIELMYIKSCFFRSEMRKLFIAKIEEQGLENKSANMRIVANEIREKHGNDAIVVLFLEQAKEVGDKNVVIDSIRAIAEAHTLKANNGILIAIDADQQLRYERIRARQSTSDKVSFEEFMSHENLEMNDPNPHGMQKAEVMKMADYTIENNGTLEELHQKVEEFLDKYNTVQN